VKEKKKSIFKIRGQKLEEKNRGTKFWELDPLQNSEQ
jgi:hypothetical protein